LLPAETATARGCNAALPVDGEVETVPEEPPVLVNGEPVVELPPVCDVTVLSVDVPPVCVSTPPDAELKVPVPASMLLRAPQFAVSNRKAK
jgi:hypothetical protein